jgi:hypothetical protein
MTASFLNHRYISEALLLARNRLCLDCVHVTGRILGFTATWFYPVNAVAAQVWFPTRRKKGNRAQIAARVVLVILPSASRPQALY